MYELTLIEKSTYLHFIVTGENTKENILKYFEEIHRDCADRNYNRILIEVRLEGSQLSMIAMFDIIEKESIKNKRFLKAIAYVDINVEKASLDFFETVAFNRSLPLFAFSTVSDAEKWLLGKNK